MQLKQAVRVKVTVNTYFVTSLVRQQLMFGY
jgi:hypothetical protein